MKCIRVLDEALKLSMGFMCQRAAFKIGSAESVVSDSVNAESV